MENYHLSFKTIDVTSAQRRKLRIFNFVMGVFHLIQGVVMLILSNSFTLPVTTSYLDFNLKAKSIAPLHETAFNLQIGPAVAIFLFGSAIAHFLIASPGIFNWYIKNLKHRINYIRWFEYGITSSVMIVVIAMLCGVYDLSTLILLFAINSIMNLFGLMMEKHNQTTNRTDWTSFIIGCYAGVIPWIVILLYFVGAVKNVDTAIPTFVYFIVGSLFLFFNIFAVNMFLQYKKIGPWKNYLYGEYVYIVLSLVAKSLLAWQVFSGTLRPM